MKLAEDVLIAIMGALRKGLLENTDISELLRQLELVPNGNGKLGLNPDQTDVWTTES